MVDVLLDLDSVSGSLIGPQTHCPDEPPAGEAFTTVVETQSSVVVLIGALAYKAKKPIQRPGQDLRRREERLACLRRELEIGSGRAPDLYLGLSELRPMFLPGAVGEPVLVMRRLPQLAIRRRYQPC